MKSLFKKDEETDEKDEPVKKFKTLHFHQKNVHDFAWFADPNWIVRKGELWLADSSRKVTLWSMYLPKNAKVWEQSLEYIHDAGYWYSEFYGDYPYNHITAVDGDMSAGGGMEYPNITVISSSSSKDMLEFVIMHEVGHNWFYGILGNNERDHAYLDEGINEYSNIRYWEKKYPDRNGQIIVQDFMQNKLKIAEHLDFRWVMGYLGYQRRAVSGDDQPIDIPSHDFHRSNYGSIVYGKTGIYMRYLQEYLGENKMDEVMRDYYESWKFRHPGPEDLKASFSYLVDEDLSWFFDDVIDDTKVADYAVSRMSKKDILIENIGDMSPPLELAFYGKNNSEVKRIWLKGFDNEQKVDLPNGTEKVIIDPENYLPDINRTNNATSKNMKTHFVFDQPGFYENDIYYLPWFKWSEFNGASPGLSIYSGFVPGYSYGLSVLPVLPVWDFEHDRLAGSVSAEKTFYQTMGFRSLTFSSNISQFEGRKGGMIQVSGVKRKPVVSTPEEIVSAKFFYHDINSTAVNPIYYTPGKLTFMHMNAGYINRVNPFLNFSGGIHFKAGKHKTAFTSISIAGKIRWRYSEKLTVNARGYVGSFLPGKTIPNQYKIWMSGGVDPNFESDAIFNRTDNGGDPNGSRYDIYDEQYLQSGPALRGAVYAVSEETAWGLNIDHSIPYLPVDIFLDLAGASDLDNIYSDMGLKLDLGFISLFFPLYQSWDEESSFITDIDWLVSRARFEFSIPTASFGR